MALYLTALLFLLKKKRVWVLTSVKKWEEKTVQTAALMSLLISTIITTGNYRN